MPRHKADVHPKRRSQAMQMAKGDTGQNRLNDFFGVFTQGIDSMLYEFGLYKDQEKRPGPARKPLEGQESAQPPAANSNTNNSATPAGQSLLAYIPPQSGNASGTSGSSQQKSDSQPMSENTDKQSENS